MSKLIIKKFSASWCKNCPTLSKTLSLALSEINTDNIIVDNIDVEEDDEAAVFYGIRSLPTLVFIENDQELFRCVGTRSKEELKEIIEKYVKKV